MENYIGTLTEEEMFQIDRGIQIGYGIKNNVYDYDNEEDSFVKDIANYIQEMDHLLSKLCDLKELDQKARHIDIEQLLGKDVIKYTGENPVACLWDEAKIKKRRKSRFLIHEKFSCTDISYL